MPGEVAYRIKVTPVPTEWDVGTIIRDMTAPGAKPCMVVKLYSDGADVIPMPGNRKERRTFISKNRRRKA